jgi:Holliday junction DNA helicase RuvB
MRKNAFIFAGECGKEETDMDEKDNPELENGAVLGEDARIEESVRPKTLADYIGQSKVKTRIEIEMRAARSLGKVLDHTVLDGPPGVGKTSMAHIIASERGVTLKTVRCSSIKREADLSKIICEIREGDVLFFDEGHALRRGFAEMLYSPMEDFTFDLIDEGEAETIKLPRFTVVVATTSVGLLPRPFRDRFGIKLHFNYYQPEELAIIVANAANSLGIDVDEDAAFELARRGRGTPRIAIQLLCRAFAFAHAAGQELITLATAKDTLQLWDIDQQGLDEMDRNLILAIIEKYKGGPVGIKTMAASISEEENVVTEMEPYLMRIGLLERTPRGRKATDAAYKYFGIALPRGQIGRTPAPIRAERVPTSNRLSLEEFGVQLLLTEDLDPVYPMLHKANLLTEILYPFLFGYWCFYHVGVAALLTEYKGGQFFEKAIALAQNGKGTPRGAERRHFRGEACLKSLDYFYTTYGDPSRAVADLIENCAGKNVSDVLRFVERWPEFGPWIGFKIADMLERILGISITFQTENLKLYKAPTEGAEVWCANEGLNFEELGVPGVVTILEGNFASFKAPPRYDRPVGVAEIETILCKWHSHLNGQYPVGKDSREILEHLHGWGWLAESLQKYVPKGH